MSGGRVRLSERRQIQARTKSEADREGDIKQREITTQTTHSAPLLESLERFEDEVRLVVCMKDQRYWDALNTVTDLLDSKVLRVEERFKYRVLKTECYLHLFMFNEAREEGPKLAETCSLSLLANEAGIANVAYRCRENKEFVRALLYYQCSLQCWMREMRDGRIKKRSIEVINRGEKFALVVLHLGLSNDTRGIVYEYALPIFQEFIHQYEDGPEQLSAHRDLAIMGCCYYIADALKKLDDNNESINFASHGINIGMKSLKEHKNHLLAKSNLLLGRCYMDLKDSENAETRLNQALKLCPLMENWDYQSSTEIKEDFEKEVQDYLKKLKKSSNCIM